MVRTAWNCSDLEVVVEAAAPPTTTRLRLADTAALSTEQRKRRDQRRRKNMSGVMRTRGLCYPGKGNAGRGIDSIVKVVDDVGIGRIHPLAIASPHRTSTSYPQR